MNFLWKCLYALFIPSGLCHSFFYFLDFEHFLCLLTSFSSYFYLPLADCTTYLSLYSIYKQCLIFKILFYHLPTEVKVLIKIVIYVMQVE